MKQMKELECTPCWSFSHTYYTMHGSENIKVSCESLMEYIGSTPLTNFHPSKANVDLYDHHTVSSCVYACRCDCEGK
jgi:hypothetical protein